MKERREFTRVEISLHAQFELAGQLLEAPVRDLSLGGAYLALTLASPPQGPFSLTLSHAQDPEGLKVLGLARVVRHGAEGLAVQWLELDLEGYHHLQNLLLLHAREPRRLEGEVREHLGLRRRSESPQGGSTPPLA